MVLDDLLSGIPVIGGMFDNSDDQALDQLRRNQELFGNIGLPTLKEYSPEEFRYTGDFNPEDAQYETVSEDPLTRSAQMSALSKLSGYADSGLSDVDAAVFDDARQMGAQMARGGREAALADAQSRGVAGSGMEFAMREIANQEGAGRSQKAALDQAKTSAENRVLYNKAYGDSLAGLRDQDYRTASGNTGIINQFNQNNTTARNNAQARNLDARQTVGNANVQNRNSAQLENNNIRQQGFDNQMGRAGAQAGANTGMAQGYAAQNAARTSERGANTALAASLLVPGGGKKPQV